MSDVKVQAKAKDHESYLVYTLISFLIPLVGFIIGAIMLTKDSSVDKKLGEHAIAMSVLGIIVSGILWFVWVGFNATSLYY